MTGQKVRIKNGKIENSQLRQNVSASLKNNEQINRKFDIRLQFIILGKRLGIESTNYSGSMQESNSTWS